MAGCRVIGRLGGRHVWGLWAMSVEGCFNCGERGHSWGNCSPSILGALTVLIIGPPDGLMRKEVEDWYPRIVLQVNSRARENNSNVYARGRLSFLVCFRASLIVSLSYS